MFIGSEEDVIELFRDISEYNSAFNHDASDKMQALGQAELPPPASCFVCGSGNCEAGYLNFGMWVDFIGNLLICAPCLVQGAEKVGCLAPSVRVLLEKNLQGLQDYAKGLESELADARGQLVAFGTIRDAFRASVDPASGVNTEPARVVEPIRVEDEGSGLIDSEPTESSESDGPIFIEGTSTVHITLPEPPDSAIGTEFSV